MSTHDTPPPTYTLPLHVHLLRPILRLGIRTVFYLLSRVRVTGQENVPAKGPYLVAINHVSLFDPPFAVVFWPCMPEVAGAAEVWQRPGQSLLARGYGGIPVHRGEYDRKLIDKMLSALRSGRPLLLAPEGGRSHTLGMRRGQPGMAYLVEQTGVPVIPAAIIGTPDDFLKKCLQGKRPLVEMRIGKPLYLPPVEGKGAVRRAARQRNADLIMLAIAEILPPEYHGVYASGIYAPGMPTDEPGDAQAGQ